MSSDVCIALRFGVCFQTVDLEDQGREILKQLTENPTIAAMIEENGLDINMSINGDDYEGCYAIFLVDGGLGGVADWFGEIDLPKDVGDAPDRVQTVLDFLQTSRTLPALLGEPPFPIDVTDLEPRWWLYGSYD